MMFLNMKASAEMKVALMLLPVHVEKNFLTVKPFTQTRQ